MIKFVSKAGITVPGTFISNKLIRRVFCLLLFTCLLHSYEARAQVSTYYVWSQSDQTYKSDTSTTSTVPANVFITSWDDNTYTGYKFPFNFNYKGTTYTAGIGTIGVDTDGWVAFTTGAITMTGTTGGGSWVSILDHTGVYLTGTANNDGFCGFNSDLQDQTWTSITGNTTNGSNIITNISDFSDLRVGTRLSGTGITDGTVVTKINLLTTSITTSAVATATGTAVAITPRTSIYAFTRGVAPYRQFVIQWTRAARYSGASSGDDFSFQLVLNEGGGNATYQTLQVVYGTCKATSATAQNAQVGLRGATSADFNARTTTTNWSATTAAPLNSSTCSLTSSVFPNSGLTYTWSPACLAVPSNAGAISGSTSVCPGTIVDYSITGVPGAIYYTWTYTGTNTTYSGTTTLPLNTLDFSTLATGGTLTVTPGNLCGNGVSSSIVISMNGLPTATVTYSAASYCTSAAPVTPTITGTLGGTFTVSPSGLTINASTGQITPSTSAAGNYVVTYTFVSGCSATVTKNITINAGPVVTATATPANLCSVPNSAQLQATIPVSNYTLASIAYTSLTPSAGSTILWNTYQLDNISGAIAMPFTFNYYGSPITNFIVSTEGYVQLQTGTAVEWTPQTLPNATIPNNIIALAWADLIVDPSTNPGSSVRYFVNGVAPNRILIVDYINLRFLVGSGAQNVTGQIRLYESDSHIEIAAGTVNDDGDAWPKTMGIENSTGTLATTPPGRNNVVWNTTNEAWSFTPASNTYTYSWSPGTALSSTTIANPVVTNLASTVTYTVTVTNTSTGCSGTANVTISAGGSGLSGTYTVGVGGNYTTLTAAVNAYNTSCLGGPVIFSLIDNTYPGETFPIIINNNANASSVNTLTIKPAATKTPLITGSSATILLQLRGADYVTIDGSNTASGTTRNLSFTNTAATSNAVIWLTSSSVSDGANNNTIKNCNVYGASSSGTIASILTGSYLTAGADAEFANNNNTIQNNLLYRAQNAVYQRGNVSSPDLNWTVTQNNIGSVVIADKLGFRGMAIVNSQNFTITSNIIAGVTLGSAGFNAYGIGIYLNILTGMISENSISDVKHTGFYGAHGIYLGPSNAACNLTIQNNFIYDVAAGGFNNVTSADNGYGITADAGGGYKIYFNTVVLNTNPTTTSTANHRSAAMLVTSGVTAASGIDLRNNIFDNRQTFGGANSRYALLSTAANTVYANINFNGYYSNGSGNLACQGSNATQWTTLAQIQANISGNANSTTAAAGPTFVSATDYHVQSIAGNSLYTNLGTTITGITTDYDVTTRNGLNPDLGADEWLMPNTGSWVGKTSIDWLVNTNWETNKIPDRSIDVTINGGYTFMPTVVTTQAIRGLNLAAPVPSNIPVLTLNAGTLQVYGTMVRTAGSIDGANGTLEMDSSISAQPIPAGLFLNNSLKNLVINNSAASPGVSINGPLDIYRSVTFGAAGIALTTNSNITFKSTATETAWLGVMTGKTWVGTAKVERYIPTGINHGKSWQLLSVPIRGGLFLKQNWMENNNSLVNGTAGFGTTISSEVAGATGRGYDFYTAPGPSLKTYVSATNTYAGVDNGIANTNAVNIFNPKGYMLLVRGDRSVQSSSATATPTVLRLSGSIYTATPGNTPPTQTVTANKFESIGNPYISAIDFTTLTKGGGLDNAFYLWDPLLAGSNSLGGWQTFSAVTGWLPTPGSLNYSAVVAYSRIQSGQAFFAHATVSNGTVAFTEAAKVQSSQLVMRPGPDADVTNRQFLRVNMYRVSRIHLGPVDGNAVAFDKSFSNNYNGQDALKMNNADENIGIFSNERQLTIEARKPVKNNDTIFYNISNLRLDAYQLRFGPENMSSLMMSAWLVDKFLNTMTPVSLSDSTTIDFSITADAGSYAADRFYLVFKKTRVLPVIITHIAANRSDEKEINVNWSVENEAGIENYEIERSGDGRNFNKINIAEPKLNNGKSSGYVYPDQEPLAFDNFYRIKAIGRSGEVQYSSIVKVGKVKGESFIGAYPNPVVNKNLAVSFVNQEAGTYNIQLSNQLGQVMLTKRVFVNSNNSIESIQLDNDLATGNYQLVITTGNGKKISQQVMIN